VFSENDEGDCIRVTGVNTDQEEGFVVATSIFEMKYSHRLANRDFAILYRTNAQSRIFEEALRKCNIPYKIYGGLSFYERKEIKDALAYGRLLVNPKDDEAFRRVINFPARGIGNTTIERLATAANATGISLWEAAFRAEQLAPDIAPAARGKLHKFIDFMNKYAEKQNMLDAYDMLNELINATEIISLLKAEKTPENISRLENIDELLNAVRSFVEENASDNTIVGLDQYLANVSLLTNADNEKPEDNDKVTVATVHQSKGLEFDVVYIVGLEENLFPSQMSSMYEKDIEEERRLFYVALTRARKYVFLSYANVRFRYGSMLISAPSRFIKEIDPRFLDFSGGTKANTFTTRQPKPVFDFGQNKYTSKLKSLNTADAEALHATSPQGATADNTQNIKPGMTVEHARYGLGKVLAIDNNDGSVKATVHFGSAGQKQLLVKFAKLKIVK